MPFWPSTLNGLMAPVLASILPTDMVLFGVTAANHRLPSKIGGGVMGQRGDARGRSLGPVRAVVRRRPRRQVLVGIEGDVVFGEHRARRFARRARPAGDAEAAGLRPARLGEIGGELGLMVVEHLIVAVRQVVAVDVDVLHRLDDGGPAGFVEPVLQRVARRVAARAVVVHDPPHADVVGGLGGQAGEDQVARQLPHLALGVRRSWRARNRVACAGLDVDLARRRSRSSAPAPTRGTVPAGSGGK